MTERRQPEKRSTLIGFAFVVGGIGLCFVQPDAKVWPDVPYGAWLALLGAGVITPRTLLSYLRPPPPNSDGD